MDFERYDQIISEQEAALAGILSQGGNYEDLLALCEDRNQRCLIAPPHFELGQAVQISGLEYTFKIVDIDRVDGRWIYQEDQDDGWFFQGDLDPVD